MPQAKQDSDVYKFMAPPPEVLAKEEPVPPPPPKDEEKKPVELPVEDAAVEAEKEAKEKEEEAKEEAEEKKEEEEELQENLEEEKEEEQEKKEEEEEEKEEEVEELQEKLEEEQEKKDDPTYPLLFLDGKPIEKIEGTGLLDMVEEDNSKMTVPIKDGKKNGEAILVDEDGILFKKLTYVDDELHGRGQSFYSDGKTRHMEFFFEHDVLSGPFTCWGENGLKQSEATYKKGAMTGHYIVYDLEEEVAQIQEWNNNLQDGETRTYLPKSRGGKLYKTEFFEKGVRKWEKTEKF